jgi:hypothetical protein
MKQSALPWGVTLVAGIVAVYLWHQLQTERELTAQLRNQGPQVSSSALPAPSELSAPADAPAAQTIATGTTTPAATTVAAAPQVLTPTESVRAGFFAASPTVVEKVGSSLKLNQLQTRYPGLVKELLLTQAEAEAFQDLLLKHDATLNSVMLAGASANADPQEIRQKLAETQKVQAAELEAQLGPGRSRAWQDYQTTVDARRRVNELTMMLASSSPITEAQAGPLLSNILTEQKRRATDESLRTPPGKDPSQQLEFEEQNLQARIESNRRTIDAAKSFMNPEQVSLMQDSMDRFNERTRVSLQARRARLESGAGSQR